MTVTMSMTIILKEIDDPAGTGGESALSRPSEGVVGTIAALTHQKSSLELIYDVSRPFGMVLTA